jgi:hypothetical protein
VSKLRDVQDANKKRGRGRDKNLLKDILITLFWARTYPNRSVYDILDMLPKKYEKINKDTLEDNLEFLSKVPEKEPFVVTMSENIGVNIYSLDGNTDPVSIVPLNTGHKPRNSYLVNPYYIKECFRNSRGYGYSLDAIFTS